MSSPLMSPKGEGITIVYDGDCPFCSRYVAMLRLRDAVGAVRLIDARSGDPVAAEMQAAGFDLNEGMVARIGGRTYHGSDCVHLLAMLSSDNGWLNSINARVFRSPKASAALYPVLRFGRNLTLRLLGRQRIARLG